MYKTQTRLFMSITSLSKVIFVIELFWKFSEYFTVERKIWQFIIRIRSEIPDYTAWLWKLIYESVDCQCASRGMEFMLNFVRSKVWICQGRKTVKRVLRNCFVCTQYQGRPVLPPRSPDLQDFWIHFILTDLTVFIKSGKDSALKAYFLLLTCAQVMRFTLSWPVNDLLRPIKITTHLIICHWNEVF